MKVLAAETCVLRRGLFCLLYCDVGAIPAIFNEDSCNSRH